jgi:HEAT repeat protein
MDFLELGRSIARQHWADVVRSVQEILNQASAPDEPRLSPTQQQTVLEALLLALEWGDFQVRWEVAKVLPTLGDGAIAPLLDWLQDDEADPEVQWFVVRMLGSWAGAGAIDRVLDILQSGTPELQAMAVLVLVQHGNGIVDRLKPLLAQAESRRLAVQVLAGIRSRETLEVLLTTVTDDDPEVRMMALDALSSFQDDRLGSVFSQAIADPVASVRQTAAMAIGFCQTMPMRSRVEHLAPLLWDVQLSVCCAAASSLGRVDHGEAIAALRKVLFSQPLPVNLGLEVVRSLFHIGTAEAIDGLSDYLIQSIASPDDTALALSSDILCLLGRVESSPAKSIALEALLDCLEQPQLRPNDRILAITALGQLKILRSIDTLILQLIHPSSKLRLHIIHALQQINSPLAHQALTAHQAHSTPSLALQNGIQFALTEWR